MSWWHQAWGQGSLKLAGSQTVTCRSRKIPFSSSLRTYLSRTKPASPDLHLSAYGPFAGRGGTPGLFAKAGPTLDIDFQPTRGELVSTPVPSPGGWGNSVSPCYPAGWSPAAYALWCLPAHPQ